VVLVEDADVLGDRLKQLPEGREGAPVDGVAVRGGDHVGPGLVDLRVDGEGGKVHWIAALNHLALVVDEDQVAHPDVLEGQSERVDPEVVRQLGVAGGDVAGHALLEAELAEDPQGGREPLLAVPPPSTSTPTP
jgi:hypothetical protein